MGRSFEGRPVGGGGRGVPATLIGIACVLLGLVVVFSVVQPRFLSPTTLSLIFRYYSPVSVLALGMTFVILVAGIDLSVGFLMVLLMFVMATAVTKGGIPPVGALLLGLVSAVVVGVASGAAIAVARMPPFIVTLAVMVGANGATLLLSGNQSVGNLPPELLALGSSEVQLLGHPFPLTILLVPALYAGAALFLRRTRSGRALVAVGANREAARLSGLPIRRLEASAYVFMAICCWLAAWIQLGVNRTADPKVALSDSLELNAIAMVVIGGTSLSGGRATLAGTALGALLLAVLFNGLPMLGGQFGDTSWRKLVQAAVILAGACLDVIQRRSRPG